MKSENFDFTIKGGDGPVYDITPRYLGAEGGKSYPSAIPAFPDTVEGTITSDQSRLSGDDAAAKKGGKAGDPVASLKTFGGTLFSSLFPANILGAFEAKLGSAKSSGSPLRIGIELDGAPTLARLPWEAMFSKATDRFIGVDRHSNIVRLLSPRLLGEEPANFQPPVKILVAIANPEGNLKTQDEVRAISEHLTGSLGSHALFALTIVENVSQYRLNEAIFDHKPDILHFIGHGGFAEDAGVLLLCGEEDHTQSVPLDTQALGDNLVNYPPRLVFLNSCQGATAAPRDRYAGTAQSLIGMNIPYVVAMQFPISDKGATAFAERFYAALADGETIETSVTLGRSAVRSLSPAEFATPVLYCGCREGGLQISTLPPPSDDVTFSASDSGRKGRWIWGIGGVGLTAALLGLFVYFNQPLSKIQGAPTKSAGGDNAPPPYYEMGGEEPGNSTGPTAGPSFGRPPRSRPSRGGSASHSGGRGPASVGTDDDGSGYSGEEIPPSPPPPVPPPPPPVPPLPPPPPDPTGGSADSPCGPSPFTVFFDFDKAVPILESRPIIEYAAAQFKHCPKVRMKITGHADRVGSSAYNTALSARRAKAVEESMEQLGILPDAVSTEAKGETQPLVETADGVREPQNRRVEIYFIPDTEAEGGV